MMFHVAACLIMPLAVSAGETDIPDDLQGVSVMFLVARCRYRLLQGMHIALYTGVCVCASSCAVAVIADGDFIEGVFFPYLQYCLYVCGLK